MKNVERGQYGQILTHKLSPKTRKQVENLFKEAKASEKVDEHGNWTFGVEHDQKRGETHSVNWDLYAVGRDYFSRRTMIVIQIREFYRQKAGYFPTVKKSHFLIGRNEDNTAFAHPVPTRTVNNSIEKEKDVVKACQDYIFGTDYTKVIRQGDIALIPLKKTAHLKEVESLGITMMLIEESHKLESSDIRQNGNLYAKNPSLSHLPKTHPDFMNLKGWYKVVVGRRGKWHDFAAPSVD